MKPIQATLSLLTLVLITGCSSAPAANRYISSQEQTTPSTPASEDSKPSQQPTKDQQIEDAKKNNVSAGQTITDSIINKPTDQTTADSSSSSAIKESIAGIRTLVKELKQHAEQEEEEQMITTAATIIQEWQSTKPAVTTAYPDMTTFVQEKVTTLKDLIASDSIDMEAILQLDYELYQALRQLLDQI